MDDKSFTPISGTSQETAEPIDTTAAGSSIVPPTSTPSRLVRESSTSSTTTAKKLQPKRNPSTSSSPAPSRETSPIRPQVKPTANRSTAGPGRSRKNSTQDPSPSRSANATANPPSAAATQRALSAATTPNLHPISYEPTIKAPVPQKPLVTSEIRETPRWPVSPRLRSPPPVSKPSILSPRKLEHEVPGINVQRTGSAEQKEAKAPTDTEVDDESLLPSGMRTPVRGASGSTLETVQEISQPNTPGSNLDGILEKAEDGMVDQENPNNNALDKTIKAKGSNESGSDSGGKGEIKMRPTAPPTSLRPNAPVKAYSTSTNTRGKPSGEGSTKNMTVETETVSSIPQVAVGGPAGGSNGSIRAKPSSETIRPKKEKKKTARKTPSVTSGMGEQANSSRPRFHHHHTTRGGISADSSPSHSPETIYSQGLYNSYDNSGAASPERPSSQVSQASQASRRTSSSLYNVGLRLTKTNTASSKADIFEAKVASAVDEADSSDSEETFVYESNPPEAIDRPRRFHSRTPSATSMASQIDQRNGARAIMDGGHSVAMKKSMKFANSYNDRPEQAKGEDDGKGTARSNIGTGRGTTHHHHIPRFGRNNGNGHQSLFDNESPFPNATKPKSVGGNPGRHSSRPSSPRVSQLGRMVGNGKKSPISSGYDLDDGADDERTPLIGTVRSSRSGRNRRPAASSLRLQDHQASHKSFLARFAGCMALTVMIILVISGAVGFMLATTQPLTDAKITAIKNVLASEQDVIFDMQVQARNPNLMAISIDTTDLLIFAKSKYAGTDHEYYKRPHNTMKRGFRGRQWGSNDPFDPPNNGDPTTNPNLEIGHILELYSPLTFEGSPFKDSIFNSVGQVRIDHPGNHTTPAGSERWGKVVEHEFELLVRGTLKYTLPLSQTIRKLSVEGRVTVKPNAADQDSDVHITL